MTREVDAGYPQALSRCGQLTERLVGFQHVQFRVCPSRGALEVLRSRTVSDMGDPVRDLLFCVRIGCKETPSCPWYRFQSARSATDRSAGVDDPADEGARGNRLDAESPQRCIVGLRWPLVSKERLTDDRGQIGPDPPQHCGPRR